MGSANMTKLSGKVALVTGANRGIGKGIARGLAKEGAKLTIAARDEKLLAEAARELQALGAEVLAVATDVTDEAQVERLFAASQERYGRLDVAVSNAGAFDGGRFDKLSSKAWDKVIAVNLRGPFLCGRAAFRIMKEQKGGRIINIGSISAQRAREGSAPYTTSKFGLWGMTQAMALDGRPHGIAVSCLHPGNVLTERRAGSSFESDKEPMMSVDELAEVCVLMASLPPHVNMLEAIVLPVEQLYLGRG
jgi:NAD(P)-dependent dehydrogenase (short-subunit alcohol dehydrogenase family)